MPPAGVPLNWAAGIANPTHLGAGAVGAASAMPALPSSKNSRRKGVKPIAKQDQDDVWMRKLDSLGLEPLNSPRPAAMELSTASSIEAPTSGVRKLSILDLPAETQTEIFKNVSSAPFRRSGKPSDIRLHCLHD